MAVLNHSIHPRTVAPSDTRWGCWNRPEYSAGYFAPDRLYKDGNYAETKRFIKHVMSTECRNDISLADPRCEGCKRQGSGEAYSHHVRSHGN